MASSQPPRGRCLNAPRAYPTSGKAYTNVGANTCANTTLGADTMLGPSRTVSSWKPSKQCIQLSVLQHALCRHPQPRGKSPAHVQTRLPPDGRPALIVDPGSVGNLCGDKWAKEVAIAAACNGHKPSYKKRARPLQVSGVGKGAQSCRYDCHLPVGLRHAGNQQTSLGELTIPSVQGSDLPGLLGKLALKKNRAVWDFVTDTLYFTGLGD